MRALLLLLGLAAVVRAQTPVGWAGLIAARSTVNEVRMNTIRQRLDGLAEKLKGVGAGVATDALGLRVRALTGNGCKDKEFQCGGDAPQCVNNILICDGSVDCRNSNDESSRTCTNPYTAGNSASGSVRFTNCALKGKATVRAMITSDDAKPGRSALTATIILQMDNGDVISENTSGNYWFGGEMLALEPTPGQKIGIRCNYNRVDGSCSGSLVNNNGDACASVVLA